VNRLKREPEEGGFGETIKADDLGKIFFYKNLTAFKAFGSISETLATAAVVPENDLQK